MKHTELYWSAFQGKWIAYIGNERRVFYTQIEAEQAIKEAE